MRSDRGMQRTTAVRCEETQPAQPPFEIRERTFQFAVRVVGFVKRFPCTLDAIEIGRQLLRAATSVGANVEEAHGAESQRDFVHIMPTRGYKMGIACKEVRETRYWLRLVKETILNDDEINALLQESDELVRILSTIVTKARKKT
jgi:four helix bundle protein